MHRPTRRRDDWAGDTGTTAEGMNRSLNTNDGAVDRQEPDGVNCESSLCPHPVPVSFSKISNFKYFGEPRPRRLDSIYTRKLSCHKSASLLEWYYMLIYWSNDYRYPACSINLRLTSCLPLQLLARVAAGCPQWPGSRLCTKGTEDRGRRGGSPRERVLRASNRQKKTHTGSNNNKLLGSPEYITQRHQGRPPIVRCTEHAGPCTYISLTKLSAARTLSQHLWQSTICPQGASSVEGGASMHTEQSGDPSSSSAGTRTPPSLVLLL